MTTKRKQATQWRRTFLAIPSVKDEMINVLCARVKIGEGLCGLQQSAVLKKI